MDIDYTVAALMFPAIPLMMTMYSNRFHTLSALIRQLHEWSHYRRNGKLWRKYYYKEGKKDGKWTWYDTYGNLVRTELY